MLHAKCAQKRLKVESKVQYAKCVNENQNKDMMTQIITTKLIGKGKRYIVSNNANFNSNYRNSAEIKTKQWGEIKRQ